MVSLLEDISKETYPIVPSPTTQIGVDPELDQFMVIIYIYILCMSHINKHIYI